MRAKATFYELESAAALRALESAVHERFDVGSRSAVRTQVTVHETHDWRIHAAGATLQTTRHRDALVQYWSDATTGEVLAKQPCDAEPGLAADLAPGPVTDRLARVLGNRRALPLVRLDVNSRTLAVYNEEQKTVVRIVLATARPRGAPAKGKSRVWRYVRVTPLRGYRAEFAAADAFVAEHAGAPWTAADLHQRAVATTDRVPGDYSSKAPVTFDPTMRSDRAMKQLYLTLLDVMVANEAGIRGNLDAEFLHDFRTAVRRTRAALSQMKGVFPKSVVDRAKAQFRWLGQITGPKRDSDVYLEKLPDYQAELPKRIRADLAPMLEFLASHDQFEHERLTAALNSRRYRDWIKSWRTFLERPDPKRPRAPNALRPIRDLASERISKADRRVLKAGRAIKPSTPAEAVHDLRIDCKKLRYLITFFRSVYPAKVVRGCLGDLSGLQDNLGDFNDLEVQQDSLRRFGREMRTEGFGNADTLIAIGWLVERLAKRQARERKRFHKQFDAFDTPKHHKRMRRLLATGAGEPA